MHFRKFCNPDIAFPLMDYLCQCVPVQGRPGPCGVFLSRIQDVGWRWDGGGVLLDHDLIPIHLFKTPIQVIITRLTAAWWNRVGAIVSSRKGFQGLENLDVKLTIAKLDSWTEDRKGLLQVALNGTYYTRDMQFHGGLYADKQCPWCRCDDHPVVDSTFHRHWCCPRFQASRDNIPTEFFTCIEELPECCINHAWCTKSPVERMFLQLLTTLPDLSHDFFPVSLPDGPLHMFTDGSCIMPANSDLRIATWGVVVATLEAAANSEFQPVSQGPVPGLHQTIYRGEVWAAISACRFALRKQSSFWLWCDNQQLVSFVKDVRKGCPPPTINDKDHDLLGILYDLVTQAVRLHLFEDIIKVRSHEDERHYHDVIEQWVIRGNSAADDTAARARQGFSPHFVHVWTALKAHYEHSVWIRDQVHAHFVRVGWESVEEKSRIKQVGLLEPDTAPQQAIETNRSGKTVSFTGFLEIGEYNPSTHMTAYANTVSDWLRDLTAADDAEVQWVTSYQLLVDFQIFSGSVGVRFTDRQWVEIAPWETSSDYKFPRIARWFAAFLKSLAKDLDLPYEGIHTTPTSFSFRCWTRCIQLRLSRSRMLCIDRWWKDLGIVPIKKVGQGFSSLPVVSRSFLNT